MQRLRDTLDRWLRRPPVLHVAGDVGARDGDAGVESTGIESTGEGSVGGPGAGRRGKRPVVVLVHGIASSSVTFQNLVPLLEPSHRVISIDILGFGGSPAPVDAEYTLEEHAAALHRTLRSLRLREPFVLVGHSLGALIVTRYAAQHPGALSRLVLVGLPIYGTPDEIGDRRVRTRVSAYLRAYEFLRANKDFTIRNANILGKLLPIRGVFELDERTWTPFVRSLENCIEKQTVVSDLARVRVPVQVVYGTLDAFIAPGSLAVVETMRHVTMHRVEANDHLIRKRLARVVAAACTPQIQ